MSIVGIRPVDLPAPDTIQYTVIKVREETILAPESVSGVCHANVCIHSDGKFLRLCSFGTRLSLICFIVSPPQCSTNASKAIPLQFSDFCKADYHYCARCFFLTLATTVVLLYLGTYVYIYIYLCFVSVFYSDASTTLLSQHWSDSERILPQAPGRGKVCWSWPTGVSYCLWSSHQPEHLAQPLGLNACFPFKPYTGGCFWQQLWRNSRWYLCTVGKDG